MSRNRRGETVDKIGTREGVWRERGGLDELVILDMPAVTQGMVVVAKVGEPWREKPNLRWQVWPDLLVNVKPQR